MVISGKLIERKGVVMNIRLIERKGLLSLSVPPVVDLFFPHFIAAVGQFKNPTMRGEHITANFILRQATLVSRQATMVSRQVTLVSRQIAYH